MLLSAVLSGWIMYCRFNDIIFPAWFRDGVDLYVYVLEVIALLSIVFKLITGILGLTAFSYGISDTKKNSRLTIAGKLAMPIAVCGFLCLFLKVFYADGFIIMEIVDVILDISLGFLFVFCSMVVRAGRE